MRSYRIDDEGDSYEVIMFEGDDQVGAAVVEIDLYGDDDAHDLARALGAAFVARNACERLH